MAEVVTRDMAPSGWLKLAALCLFRAQSVSKNKAICDCAGARPQSDILTLLSNSLLILLCLTPDDFSRQWRPFGAQRVKDSVNLSGWSRTHDLLHGSALLNYATEPVTSTFRTVLLRTNKMSRSQLV